MTPLAAAILAVASLIIGIGIGLLVTLVGFNTGHRVAKGMTPAPLVDWKGVRQAVQVIERNKKPQPPAEPVPAHMQTRL